MDTGPQRGGDQVGRLEYIDLGSAEAEARRAAESVKLSRGGDLPNLYHIMLHSPPVTEAWLHLGTAIRYRTEIDGRLRELAICAVAKATGSAYEWAQHAHLARAAGVTGKQLDALDKGPPWEPFDRTERACLGVVTAVVHNATLSDDDVESVLEACGQRGLLELTALAAYYSGVARFLTALEVDVDEHLM